MNYDMGVNRHVLRHMKYIITKYIWNTKRGLLNTL